MEMHFVHNSFMQSALKKTLTEKGDGIMKSKGFTLIELMIVVAIIAIIAAIAIPNLLRSRMAANETAAVAACKAFATAEDIYRRTDYNKDGVLEYAQALSGANSLYENTAGAGDLALIDRSFANAEGAPLSTATPKSGYVFNVLTSEGANASGGARTFVDGSNHMTLGYAMGATSNQYDGVGRNTFVISNAGTIYEKDQGSSGTPPVLFDPDSTWVIAE
jgi:prepilin-type N-terminal cleavage/methylation domain-containing protein